MGGPVPNEATLNSQECEPEVLTLCWESSHQLFGPLQPDSGASYFCSEWSLWRSCVDELKSQKTLYFPDEAPDNHKHNSRQLDESRHVVLTPNGSVCPPAPPDFGFGCFLNQRRVSVWLRSGPLIYWSVDQPAQWLLVIDAIRQAGLQREFQSHVSAYMMTSRDLTGSQEASVCFKQTGLNDTEDLFKHKKRDRGDEMNRTHEDNLSTHWADHRVIDGFWSLHKLSDSKHIIKNTRLLCGLFISGITLEDKRTDYTWTAEGSSLSWLRPVNSEILQPVGCLLKQNGTFRRQLSVFPNVATLKSPLRLRSDRLWSLLFACWGQGLYICGTWWSKWIFGATLP